MEAKIGTPHVALESLSYYDNINFTCFFFFTEPINTEELFANLKRETDDIKALTTKKFVRRQVVSNWAKYEEPPPDPDFENDIKGADFESLIQAPISGLYKFHCVSFPYVKCS